MISELEKVCPKKISSKKQQKQKCSQLFFLTIRANKQFQFFAFES